MMIKTIAQSEMVKNYAGAIAILLGALPAVGSLAISLVTVFRGEPYAEKTWTTLKKQVDEQTSAINSINLKLAKMEALEEGLRLGRLQQELESLKNNIEKKEFLKKKCSDGKILQDNKCVPASAADKVQQGIDTKKLDATRKLLDEVKKVQKKPSMIKLQKLPLIPEGES